MKMDCERSEVAPTGVPWRMLEPKDRTRRATGLKMPREAEHGGRFLSRPREREEAYGVGPSVFPL